MTRKPAAAALALACVVLALAAFVTTTSEGALWSWGGDDRSTTESPDETTCEVRDCDEEPVDREIREIRGLDPPAWLNTLSNVLLWLLAAFLVGVILRRLRINRREKLLRSRVEGTSPQPYEQFTPTDPELLADELEARLAALAGGSPRNAIVAAWIALETAAERAGIERRDTETPTEFTARALSRYRLDPDALQRLADLYREARFSRHRLTEHHLTQARDCLTVLTSELRGAPRASGSPS